MFSFLGRDERLFRLQRAFDRPRVLAVLDRVAIDRPSYMRNHVILIRNGSSKGAGQRKLGKEAHRAAA